jgi:hypothetical protein
MLTTRSKIFCILWQVTQRFRIGQPWGSSNGWLMRMRHWAVDFVQKGEKILADWQSKMFRVGPCFVSFVGRVADESHYALSRSSGISAITELCIAVLWVTDSSQSEIFANISQTHSASTYSLCMLWLCFSLRMVKKTTAISATRSSTAVLISP